MAHIKGKPAEGHVHNDMWYDPESNNFLIFNADKGRWNLEFGERWFPGLKTLRRLTLSGKKLSAKDVVRLQGNKSLQINKKGDLIPWEDPKNRNRSRLFLAQSAESKAALEKMRFTQIPAAEKEELIITQMRNYRKRGVANNPAGLIAYIKASRRRGDTLGVEARTRLLEQDFNLVEDSEKPGNWITKKTDLINQTKKNLNNNNDKKGGSDVPNEEVDNNLSKVYVQGSGPGGNINNKAKEIVKEKPPLSFEQEIANSLKDIPARKFGSRDTATRKVLNEADYDISSISKWDQSDFLRDLRIGHAYDTGKGTIQWQDNRGMMKIINKKKEEVT